MSLRKEDTELLVYLVEKERMSDWYLEMPSDDDMIV
jgi:hypothetical protein